MKNAKRGLLLMLRSLFSVLHSLLFFVVIVLFGVQPFGKFSRTLVASIFTT